MPNLLIIVLAFVSSCSQYEMGYKPTPPGKGNRACVLVSVRASEAGLTFKNLKRVPAEINVEDKCGLNFRFSGRLNPFEEKSLKIKPNVRCIFRTIASNENCTQVIDTILGGGR